MTPYQELTTDQLSCEARRLDKEARQAQSQLAIIRREIKRRKKAAKAKMELSPGDCDAKAV